MLRAIRLMIGAAVVLLGSALLAQTKDAAEGYFPLKVKSKWVYKVGDNDVTVTVVKSEKVGGGEEQFQVDTIVGKVVDDYNSVDDKVIAAVTHLYEDYVDQNAVDKLKSALTKIVSLSRRDDLANLSDSEAWKIISALVGGDLAQLTQNNAVFAEITTIAQKTLDFLNGGWQTLGIWH